MRILGIEGTAWAASAALFETHDLHSADDDHVFIETDAYQPSSGGIHPREAAEHMGEKIPSVVETAIAHAQERAVAAGEERPPIDAVAFSRGPGLGPCLRIVATAARAVAQRFDVPLVGVNHMVAHLEVGRHRSGFSSPVCLNASGANAHVLGYRNGRYRVLGETMDTGAGNAIDKFTRHVGWQHPGGPKVEQHALDGEYHPLPYVVKGMDFSFSGVMSAAKQAVDDGVPVDDVCRGLEETIFGMLTEVSERALSLTGADELVLGGGVGQNQRLQGMLEAMCEQRGAKFHAPENRFLRDNAGMIAMLGAKMYAAGDTVAIADSAIDSNFRPDEVEVTWRGPDERVDRVGHGESEVQGAEATVTIEADRVVKERNPRSYRHPKLDERLRTERTRQEVRLTSEARHNGVPTPLVLDVDPDRARIVFQAVGASDLRESLNPDTVAAVGGHLARIHDAGFVHGDPTTRNVRVGRRHAPPNERAGSARSNGPRAKAESETSRGGSREHDGPRAEAESETSRGGSREHDGPRAEAESEASRGGSREHDGPRTFLIDFGLGYYTQEPEDHAMDLHVLAQSLAGTADDPEGLFQAACDAYRTESAHADAVFASLADIEGRGRYQ